MGMAVEQSARPARRLQQHGSRLVFAGAIEQRHVAKIFREEVDRSFISAEWNQYDAALESRASLANACGVPSPASNSFASIGAFVDGLMDAAGDPHLKVAGEIADCFPQSPAATYCWR